MQKSIKKEIAAILATVRRLHRKIESSIEKGLGAIATTEPSRGPGRPRRSDAEAACVVPGCTRRSIAKRLCNSHYRKAKRLGIKSKPTAKQLAVLKADGRATRWAK